MSVQFYHTVNSTHFVSLFGDMLNTNMKSLEMNGQNILVPGIINPDNNKLERIIHINFNTAACYKGL